MLAQPQHSDSFRPYLAMPAEGALKAAAIRPDAYGQRLKSIPASLMTAISDAKSLSLLMGGLPIRVEGYPSQAPPG